MVAAGLKRCSVGDEILIENYHGGPYVNLLEKSSRLLHEKFWIRFFHLLSCPCTYFFPQQALHTTYNEFQLIINHNKSLKKSEYNKLLLPTNAWLFKFFPSPL